VQKKGKKKEKETSNRRHLGFGVASMIINLPCKNMF